MSKLLNDLSISKCVTKNGLTSINRNIRFKTIMLQLDLCYYNDA